LAYRLPPLSTLRTFEAAARHLSFRLAAGELNVTPSAISQQIKKLESCLGVDLFTRGANALQLTEHGVSMIGHIREGLECFVAAVESTQRVRSKSLNFSAPPSFATRWLVHHVAGFCAAHPDIAIRINSNPDNIDGPGTLAQMASSPIEPRSEVGEVAIRFGAGEYPGYWVERLLTPDYVLVCSPSLMASDRPLRALRDLRHQVLIHDEMIPAVDKRPSWQAWMTLAKVRGIDAQSGPRYSNSVLVHEAVLEGQGIALVIRQHIESDVAAGRLIIPFPISLPSAYSYYMVISKKDASKAVVKTFCEWIRREVAAASEA
jgi:LysR family transcriptional regulator, glycine cleavage system transcriptional activator